MHGPHTGTTAPLETLRRFAAPRPEVARCELCSAAIPAEHRHLVDPPRRKLLCACDACALLFLEDGTTRYRLVPRDAWALPGLRLDDAAWQELRVPIGLAFFFTSSQADTATAVYPSPAGPTEAPVPAEAWARIVGAHAALARLRPDIEALLVHRIRGACDHFVVPIDQCYRLVGEIRATWEGFTGGQRTWEAIAAFFDRLRACARPQPKSRQETSP